MLLTVLLAIARIAVMVRADLAVDEASHAVHLDLDIPWVVREAGYRPSEIRNPGESQRAKGHHPKQK
jgi:hypothetical protein